jgi:hypothetical protein
VEQLVLGLDIMFLNLAILFGEPKRKREIEENNNN